MFPRSAFALTFIAAALCAGAAQAAPVEPTSTGPALSAPGSAREPEACPGGDQTVCGRERFEAGTRAFERGQFEEARRAFQAALSLRPHPVIRYNLAVSWARLGKPTAALTELRLVLADPETDKDLRARSERELRLAEQAQAHLTFTLSDPTRDRLELDGAAVAAGSTELAIDPGVHHARILSGPSIVLDQDLDLAPGERIELRVGQRSRRIDVVVVGDAPGANTNAPPPPARTSTRRGLSPAWFVVAAGSTAVLTGLTIWSGLDTRSAYSDYQAKLPSLTQTEADRRVSEGHSRERRTNLLLTGSLVCAAGSAVLGVWFVDFGSRHPASVSLGPQQVSLTMQF